jgi:superfamily II DNA or RNA helicase
VLSILRTGERCSALAAELRKFPDRMRARGRLYAQSGRVADLRVETDDMIVADVAGTDDYLTSWFWDGAGWDHNCTCPVGYECKHAYAVAEVLLASVADTPPAPVPPPAREPTRIADDELGARFLRQLIAATDVWERRRPFEALLAACDDPHLSTLNPPFSDILRESDPEILCWRLAMAIATATAPVKVPQALRPFLARTDLQAEFESRGRAALDGLLKRWTAQRTFVGRKQVRFVIGIATGHRAQLTLEARVSSSRLEDDTRTLQQLSQLHAEALRDEEVLSVEEIAVLERLQEEFASRSFATVIPVAPAQVLDMALRQGQRKLLFWSDQLPAEVAAQTGIEPGAPLRSEPTPVCIQPELHSEGSRVLLGLFAAWPDGRRRRLEKTLFIESGQPRERPALLADGILWPLGETPPDDVLAVFRTTGPVEVPPQERLDMFARLGASFDNVAATLSLHTRSITAEPLVALELRSDDWLEARVFARERGSTWVPGATDVADNRVFERTADGRWVPAPSVTASEPNEAAAEFEAEMDEDAEAEAAPIAADEDAAAAAPDAATAVLDAEVWVEMPDAAAVQPVLEWLASLGARPIDEWRGRRRTPSGADAGARLWLRVDEDTIEDLVLGWATRPRAQYFGNQRLRRLLSGESVIRPKVKVEASGTDWFSVSADWHAEGMALSAADLAQLRSTRKSFVRLTSGWVRAEAAEGLDAAAEVLADLGIEIGAGEQRVTLWQLAGARAESLDAIEALGADAGAVKALRRLRKRVADFAGIAEVPLPQGLDADLRGYQRHGLDFLCHTSDLGLGAILADDMGLGKTVQALAWLAWLKEKRRGRGPSLVVCPTSVAPNWVREAERFVPGLKVLLLGRGKARLEQRERCRDYDLIVTNYALLRQDEEFWAGLPLRALILDEAQNIKNPDAAVARAARALNARFRLALTGTPLENRALDLWSIVECVNPGYLGRRSDFSASFDRAELSDTSRRLLAAKLRPMLLRRLKRDVATELPERIEERLDCELTVGQRKLYLAELRRSRELVERVAGDEDGLRRNKIEVLAALTRLRQICCHPALAGGDDKLGSGKFEALFELLETLRGEGHKVLVFSQFVRCLDLIARDLNAQATPFHMLTGQSTNREKIVRDFQEDPDPSVFLISLRAGGTGLNLTAASHVVLFDPWWNPAVEAQAIDRTHRIGQDKTVIACRLVAAGTVEEKIYELQQRKSALARDVLGEDGFARTLSRVDLEYLLTPS